VKAGLVNIRNQRYGQLANQYHHKPVEENAGRLIPILTVYVEDVKMPDPFFEPYHTSFVFLQRREQIRQGLQGYVPIMTTPALVPISKATYMLADVL
jgi:hypothetical protein